LLGSRKGALMGDSSLHRHVTWLGLIMVALLAFAMATLAFRGPR
jgi:hypothetical protein